LEEGPAPGWTTASTSSAAGRNEKPHFGGRGALTSQAVSWVGDILCSFEGTARLRQIGCIPLSTSCANPPNGRADGGGDVIPKSFFAQESGLGRDCRLFGKKGSTGLSRTTRTRVRCVRGALHVQLRTCPVRYSTGRGGAASWRLVCGSAGAGGARPDRPANSPWVHPSCAGRGLEQKPDVAERPGGVLPRRVTRQRDSRRGRVALHQVVRLLIATI